MSADLERTTVSKTELEVLGLAQLVLVVLVPESGDSVQMMKAGLLGKKSGKGFYIHPAKGEPVVNDEVDRVLEAL